MALIGYARVNSVGKSLAIERDRLQRCDKIFGEQRSGTAEKHPRLLACLEYVREGDTRGVTRLDRLARSALHLWQVAEELQHKGVHLRVLDQKLNTCDATARISKAIVYRYLSGTEAKVSWHGGPDRLLIGNANHPYWG